MKGTYYPILDLVMTPLFIGVFDISRHSILKLIIWRLSSWKSIIDESLLNNFIHLKLLFSIYLKEMFLLSCPSCKTLRFKFKRSLKKYLVINWRLVIYKSFLHYPLELKAFPPWKVSYLRRYSQDSFTSICVVAVMLINVVKPNGILMSQFINI